MLPRYSNRIFLNFLILTTLHNLFLFLCLLAWNILRCFLDEKKLMLVFQSFKIQLTIIFFQYSNFPRLEYYVKIVILTLKTFKYFLSFHFNSMNMNSRSQTFHHIKLMKSSSSSDLKRQCWKIFQRKFYEKIQKQKLNSSENSFC